MKLGIAVLALVLFFTGLGLYAADLNNVLFFDDKHLIINNESIQYVVTHNVVQWFSENEFAGAGRITEYYRPLLLASFAGNYAVHGLESWGYFLVNNVLHATNAVLVFLLLVFLLKRKWLAFMAALVFLVHPMQSQNVLYLASRGDLLSSFFMLAGLIVWTRGLKSKYFFLLTALSSVLLVCALLSRENAVIFPLLGVLLYVSFFSREEFWQGFQRACIHASPFFFIVAGYLMLRLTVLNFKDFLNFGNVDVTSLYAQDIFVRFYTFLHVLWEYIKTFFFPVHSHFQFTFPIHTSLFEWPVWFVFLGLCALGAVLIFFYTREQKRIHEPDSDGISNFRLWFFSVGWFFVAIAPVSGIIPTSVIIQDQRLYLALIGLALLCLFYGEKAVAFARIHGYKFVQPLAILIFALSLSFLAWITFERSIIWGKPIELFKETLRYEPDATKAMVALGGLYIDQGDYENAELQLKQALQKGALLPELYNNIGYIREHAESPDLRAAEFYYKKALELDPQSWYAHQRLVELYMQEGSIEAVYYLKRYHELNPRNANIHYNLALVLNALGANKEALQWLEEGLMLVEKKNSTAREAFEALRNVILSRNPQTL